MEYVLSTRLFNIKIGLFKTQWQFRRPKIASPFLNDAHILMVAFPGWVNPHIILIDWLLQCLRIASTLNCLRFEMFWIFGLVMCRNIPKYATSDNFQLVSRPRPAGRPWSLHCPRWRAAPCSGSPCYLGRREQGSHVCMVRFINRLTCFEEWPSPAWRPKDYDSYNHPLEMARLEVGCPWGSSIWSHW